MLKYNQQWYKLSIQINAGTDKMILDLEEVMAMKKNLTELVFILDRSGPISRLTADTIGGFNSMIEKQKEEPGEPHM